MTVVKFKGGDAVITIHDTQLPIVEYRGQRVVTLAMIDRVHARPDDTAGRNFREHRDRLIDGADYFVLSRSQSSEIRGLEQDMPNRGLIVLAEQGYLMLVKSLTDDLAWTVQRQLVNNYFRPQQLTVPRTRAEAMRLAADLEEQNELLALENQQQAAKIESLENFFMAGETPFQFVKRLNGVNCSQISHALMEMGWVFNDADLESRPHYRVYSRTRVKKWLTEKPRQIRGEGHTTFTRYDLVLLIDGAKRLHDLYLSQKLPMKKTWDGRFSYIKFSAETSL
ncbi:MULTISPECIES: ORF6N domain-containing protein [Pseudomonas]|uniref:ORF6N domain-containing protein n=1 Tax=Pseudomonas TaxID=286 RepID=UPI001CED6B8D|nr:MULTISPECIES: ORF6N domain-containing protein [Pseudomonas]